MNFFNNSISSLCNSKIEASQFVFIPHWVKASQQTAISRNMHSRCIAIWVKIVLHCNFPVRNNLNRNTSAVFYHRFSVWNWCFKLVLVLANVLELFVVTALNFTITTCLFMFLFSEFSFSNLSMIITWTLTSTTKNYMMWADIMHSQYMMQPKPIKALLQLIIVISVITITVLHCTRYFISVAIIPNCTALY